MKNLIDKAAVVAEIEKLQKVYSTLPTRNNYEDGLKEGRLIGYKDVLYKINNLEVKEVNLEEKATQLSQKYFPDEENIWARSNIEALKCKSACIEMVEWLKAQKGEQVMKVFGCKCDMSYGGGLILVAANNVEEAFLTAAMDDKVSYMFDWADDDGIWCEPDGKINHCRSSVYPLEKWFEAEHLSTDLTEPKVILEDSYYE